MGVFNNPVQHILTTPVTQFTIQQTKAYSDTFAMYSDVCMSQAWYNLSQMLYDSQTVQ